MMLISPFKMLKSSGSSSKLVERKNFPNFVSLTSSGSNSPFSSRPSVIVRNLYILNIFSSFPGRGWRNSTGLPSFTRTSAATTAMIGDRTIIASKDNKKSIHRLTYFLYIIITSSVTVLSIEIIEIYIVMLACKRKIALISMSVNP